MRSTPDLLCIGESMGVISATQEPRLRFGAELTLSAGGAESNVAIGVAARGLRAEWSSLLGEDPVGDLVLAGIRDRGVGVNYVGRRASPTGLYLKDERGPLYYRAGSAASTMDRWFALSLAERIAPRAIHVSGISAQISAGCAELLEAVCVERVFGEAVVSFDVNHRPALANDRAPALLRRFAQASDIAFVGADEAERVWNVEEADLRDLLSGPAYLIVKNADVDAVEYAAGQETRVPATPVIVREPTGAGDAFAAGWLSGYLGGASATERLTAGHRAAARVLTTVRDTPDEQEGN